MPIRITGMNSGLDTESIITELVKIQQTKVDNVKKQQTKHEWKQDAWKSLNSKIFKLYNGTIASMRFTTDYAKKTTDVSNSSLVSVITGDNAMNATQKLKINHRAETGFLTGEKLSGNATLNSKLVDLAGNQGIDEGSTFSVTAGGKTTDIVVGADTTINSVLGQLRSAGVEANFDEKNHRFFIGAKDSGKDNDFSITASDVGGMKVLQTLGLFTIDDKSMDEYTKYSTLTTPGRKTIIDDEIARRLNNYISQRESLTETLGKQQKNLDTLKLAYSIEFDNEDITSVNKDSLQASIDALKQEIEDAGEPADEQKKKNLAELERKMFHVEDYEKAVADHAATNVSLSKVNEYIASGDVASSKLITEVETLIDNKISTATSILAQEAAGTLSTSNVKRTMGTNAEIELNGETYESESNTFEVNGLTITVLGDSTDEITLTTRQDTDGIYNMIKDFIKEYNAIIKEIDTLYGAKKAKGYEPLTDEERDEMSESEIEKWEQKIKDAVLSRDSNLSTISSALKNIMLGGVTVDGQKMYLSNFGIGTLGFFEAEENERSMYHIDGDEDDDSTKSNQNSLLAAIASDPDKVIGFFAELSNSLYKELGSQMKSTDFRTYGSIYDDKKMKEDYNNYTSKIKTMEDKLKAMEDKWYSKFSAMETALARLQSNQSAVSSLLGGM